MNDKIATVSKFTGLTEDETKRFVGCLLAVGLEITESERIAKLETLVRDMRDHAADSSAICNKCFDLCRRADELKE